MAIMGSPNNEGLPTLATITKSTMNQTIQQKTPGQRNRGRFCQLCESKSSKPRFHFGLKFDGQSLALSRCGVSMALVLRSMASTTVRC